MDSFNFNQKKSLQENETSPWIENLALEEINMEESGVIHISDHLSPESFLEESSLAMMATLKQQFEFFVDKFNKFRIKSESERGTAIKVFKISNTINDFMLFRNSLKLIISRESIDQISIGLLSTTGSAFTSKQRTDEVNTQRNHIIKAQIGPFNIIKWTLHGEEINSRALVRHYLTEFIRSSAR